MGEIICHEHATSDNEADRNQVTLLRSKELAYTDGTGITFDINTYRYRSATTRDRLAGSRSAHPNVLLG